MGEPPVATRRERLRAETLAEIKERGLAQVVEGGPEALSLSAIARSMRMSGPALYRYFDSRDELLATLVLDGYEDLADAIEAAARAARRRTPGGRLHALAGAYRDWAIANPHRYRLAFSTSYGSGLVAPKRTVPPAHRGMAPFLAVLAELGPETAPAPRPAALDHQLERWDRLRPDTAGLPADLLYLGLVAWTRMHGLVSLEIDGAFASLRVDPQLVYEAEIDRLVATAGSGD